MTQMYIPSIAEEIIKHVNIITLSNRQYVEVDNPWNEKIQKVVRGEREIRVGELSFFERPSEIITNPKPLQVLQEDESMVLLALEDHVDEQAGVNRIAGEKWTKRGPSLYEPSIKRQVVAVRKDIALDATEGVYIRDLKSGVVRAAIGQTVMLNADEELWEKKMSPLACQLLNRMHDRDASRVVTYPAGDNTAVQIFDYKTNEKRVEFGPG